MTVLLDGGNWKPGLEDVLPHVDMAACSADFRVPGTSTASESAAALRAGGLPAVVVTRGAETGAATSAAPPVPKPPEATEDHA